MLSEQPNITERPWMKKKLLSTVGNQTGDYQSQNMNKYLALASNLQVKENLAKTYLTMLLNFK